MDSLKLNTEHDNPVTAATAVQASVVCPGGNNQTFICQSGYCCGDAQCCSHYYEVWWFWLVWALIIILTFVCVCQHWRAKQRFQLQRRQNEINLIAYREAHNNSQLPLYLRFLPIYLLPAYDEAVNRPATPPPPYTPLQPASLLSSPPDQASCAHLAISVPSDAGVELPVTAEASQNQCHSNQNKDLTPGRYRRFTGDSGIEVCDGHELWEQHDFFEEGEMLEDEGAGQMEEQCEHHDQT